MTIDQTPTEPQPFAERAASAVLAELLDRGGFDGWWGNLRHDLQDEIREALAAAIRQQHDRREVLATVPEAAGPGTPPGIVADYDTALRLFEAYMRGEQA